MSRSLGGTSLTRSPPIRISPSVTSSRPAIMRKVVLLPQPDGPTSTMNSLSAISRSMPRTASVRSYFLTTLRSATLAILEVSLFSALCCARGQAGDVVVHEKGVDHQRRCRREQRRRHDHAPLIDVGLHQARDGAGSQHELIRAVDEGHGIDESGPG